MQSNAQQRKLLLSLFIWRECDKPATAIALFLNRKYMQPQKASAERSDCLEPILEMWSYKKQFLSLLYHLDCTSEAEQKVNVQPASRITTSSCMSAVGSSFQAMPLCAVLGVAEMQAFFIVGGCLCCRVWAVPSLGVSLPLLGSASSATGLMWAYKSHLVHVKLGCSA